MLWAVILIVNCLVLARMMELALNEVNSSLGGTVTIRFEPNKFLNKRKRRSVNNNKVGDSKT